jgi:hypothetical protein
VSFLPETRMAWINDGDEIVLWRWDSKVRKNGQFQVPELPAVLSDYVPTSESVMPDWGGGVSHVRSAGACSDLVVFDTEARHARWPHSAL